MIGSYEAFTRFARLLTQSKIGHRQKVDNWSRNLVTSCSEIHLDSKKLSKFL